jgi:hypothetical protein
MKKRFSSILAVAAMAFALTIPVSISAAPPVPQPKAAPAATPAPEPHPEIHDAIESLRHAREHLSHASHDFGGHREDAIRAIDNAIAQLQVCMKYDR